MISGIYSLYWEESDAIYIGKSTDVSTRFRDHCNKLKAGTHTNYKLLCEFRKYGIPSLNIIEEVEPNLEQDMYLREVMWITEFDSYNNGCNLTKGGDSGPIYKGAEHPNSKATKEQLVDVFNELCNNVLTQKAISIKYNISVGIIERIAQGRGHKWLETEFPDKYKLLLSIDRSNTKTISKNFGSKAGVPYPSLVSPNGETISNISNLTSFAKENGLQASNLHKVFNKQRLSHKGWHLQ